MPSAIHAVVHEMLVLDFVLYSHAASETGHRMRGCVCCQKRSVHPTVDVKTMHNGACVEVSYHTSPRSRTTMRQVPKTLIVPPKCSHVCTP